ncbi:MULTISPECIES: hypothetical protein [unclassified Oceanispirochaeta]|uniref:hypothetical protein n=1 Tax=unclassified Oceanispirochaeta TaxID=2635722 RepID=UPI000E090074|nr:MULTISPECIES: hypothetical protein [unclassified Oceanispirochaeta]MBF9017630.1 hypothetical protein [Oceanispirochaeta sp. M2]NPD74202.1 hypothetical protein [Oceanispirochaeta sp. M1]RDG30014.1 hypothetical protein DV872_19060 [Oceanispirochaeta sp. M1]
MLKNEKIKSAGNRDSVILGHDTLQVVIDAEKSMVPELNTRFRDGWINAHWQPWFRANSGLPWNNNDHSPFWKVPLLYDIAGNFPCVPNFGPGHQLDEYDLPPHGFTAFETWEQDEPISLPDSRGYSSISTLKEGSHPFHYKKTDMILNGQNIHYTDLEITNTGSKEEPYNCGWHNTVGPPFLESGCIIDNNADKFKVVPEGGEFDATGRLAFGAETDSLEAVPLKSGGTANLRIVPGIIGYSDFITAAVPDNCELGWSSVVNPRLKLVYLSFFTGPAAISKNEIPLYFYDLWMNYGGRSYTPWAAHDGLSDQTFCLGSENSTGYYANGLKESIENDTLLGHPTHLMLPPGETRTLHYGTLFQEYSEGVLDEGISSVTCGENELILTGYNGKYIKVQAEWDFKLPAVL